METEICAEICDIVLHNPEVDANTITHLENLIQHEQHTRELQYSGPTQYETLPPHHLAHVNILCSYTNHLTLLLHHNNALNTKRSFDSNRKSHRRCLHSAKSLLETHALLHESPEYAPFRWYNNGLGSFHAFHAAVVLIALCRFDLEEVRPILHQCLARFKIMSELSPLCQKAAPLLQQLLDRVESNSPHLGERGRSMREYRVSQELQTPSSLMGGLSDGATNVYSGDIDWDIIWSEFQAEKWVTPAELPWEQWNSIFTNPAAPIECQ